MRLDKYLKVSRIIKRRTIANELCDAGRVALNGKAAKAGSEIKTGDTIELRFGDKLSRYEITETDERAARMQAVPMFRPLV